MVSIAPRRQRQALVTRPRQAAQALAAALAGRGIAALVEPLLEVDFHPAAPDLAGVQAVLCTSANGVAALARSSGERRLPLLAVGEATAARARAEGFAAIASAGGDVGDLARLAATRLDPRAGRLLQICGSAVAGDLAGDLGARGFTVERAVLYEARPVAALSPAATTAIGAGLIDVALFFSPRTAAIFVRLADDAGLGRSCSAIAALSISAAADAAIAALPWRQRRIAARPDQPALIEALGRLVAEPPV